MKLVAVNHQGMRMGEDHGKAKLSNRDVELILSLLECREMLIAEYTKVGLARPQIERSLHTAQLSFAGIGEKFEVGKSQIRRIWLGEQRGIQAERWKRVEATK
jgi:hypothetical protein